MSYVCSHPINHTQAEIVNQTWQSLPSEPGTDPRILLNPVLQDANQNWHMTLMLLARSQNSLPLLILLDSMKKNHSQE